MKNFTLAFQFFLFFFSISLYAQKIENYTGRANGVDFTFSAMLPQGKVTGILVLLPALGEGPVSIFSGTKLPEMIAEKGYITVVPKLPNRLFLNQYIINQLDQLLKIQYQKYGVSDFVIGGLSVGAAIAVGYAEHLLASGTANNLKGVFSVDGALDFRRLYLSAERKFKYRCAGQRKKDDGRLRLQKAFGGSPVSKPEEYLKNSVYASEQADGGNAKYLKNIPIRLYSEPDLEYARKTFCKDYQFNDINACDAEGLAKFLIKLGNKNAEYIATREKGYHTWNIVDAPDCVNWILRCSK